MAGVSLFQPALVLLHSQWLHSEMSCFGFSPFWILFFWGEDFFRILQLKVHVKIENFVCNLYLVLKKSSTKILRTTISLTSVKVGMWLLLLCSLGEDADLCSELLQESLDALRALPEASLFDEGTVSSVWLEVVERATKFLRSVVTG